jgi:hypothetical protein
MPHPSAVGRPVARKDVALLNDPASGVTGLQWQCSTGPVTGLGDLSGPLADGFYQGGYIVVRAMTVDRREYESFDARVSEPLQQLPRREARAAFDRLMPAK